MNHEEQERKAKLAMWSSIGEFLFGVFMLIMAETGKDSYKYYWSSDYKGMIELASFLGWLGIIVGVAELIYSITLKSAAEQTQQGSTLESTKKGVVTELIEGEVVKKECNAELQLEWITFRQKNGNMLRVYHELSDHTSYKVGDRGIVKTNDRKIVQYIPDQGNQEP